MKILILHPNLFERGGAERKVLLIYRYLKSRGVDVTLVVFKLNSKSTFFELLSDQVEVRVISGNFWYKLLKLFSFLLKNPQDILIASNHPSHYFVLFFKFLKLSKKALWICNEVHSALHLKKNMKLILTKKIERFFVKNFNLIVANSHNTKKQIENFFGLDSQVIYPGVIIKEASVKEFNHQLPNDFIFCISRLEDHKNISFLETILRKTSYNVVLAGEGSKRFYVERLASKYSKLHYIGLVSEEDKSALFLKAQLTIFLPRHEPFGVTIIESLFYGTPVIAFDSGGPREIILNGKNGVLCKDDHDFIKTLNEFDFKSFQRNPKFYHKYIKEHFTETIMLTKFYESIKKISNQT
jgi:glycosyltransferase involved in cell wall biosynthesis